MSSVLNKTERVERQSMPDLDAISERDWLASRGLVMHQLKTCEESSNRLSEQVVELRIALAVQAKSLALFAAGASAGVSVVMTIAFEILRAVVFKR